MKRQNIEAIYPLSSTQQGMLFHTLYAPQSGTYCEQIYFTLRGVDKELFRRGWEKVIARHEVLRSFIWLGQISQFRWYVRTLRRHGTKRTGLNWIHKHKRND